MLPTGPGFQGQAETGHGLWLLSNMWSTFLVKYNLFTNPHLRLALPILFHAYYGLFLNISCSLYTHSIILHKLIITHTMLLLYLFFQSMCFKFTSIATWLRSIPLDKVVNNYSWNYRTKCFFNARLKNRLELSHAYRHVKGIHYAWLTLCLFIRFI